MRPLMRHWTATLLLIEGDQVLLIYHQKFNKWTPPGGHVEGDELLHEAAIRETMEEVGLKAEIIGDEHLNFSYDLAHIIPRPFLIQLENIPAYKDQPAHQHIDAIFVGRVIGNTTPKGCEKACWHSLNSICNLEMFAESREAIWKAAEVFAHV